MTRLSCMSVRRKLGAYHDGELGVEAQLSVRAHLSGCDACTNRLDKLAAIGELVRRGAVTGFPWAEVPEQMEPAEYADYVDCALRLPATLAIIVKQAVSEKREGWPEHMGRLMLEAARVWIPGGALAVSVAGLVVLATILSIFTPTNTRSLAAVLDRGSNHNPVMVARGVTIPQVSLDAGLTLLLSGALTLPSLNLTLAAVVTREGAVSSLEVLSPSVSAHELHFSV